MQENMPICPWCQEAVLETDKFCPKCGKSLKELPPAAEKKPMEKKKLYLLMAAVLAVAVLVAMIALLLPDQPEPIAETEQETVIQEEVLAEEQQSVDTVKQDKEEILNREIFVFRNDTPEVYSTVEDIETSKAYRENWTFRRVLNEDHFDDITWSAEGEEGSTRMISFRGKNTAVDYDLDVTILFCIQEQANMPAVVSLITVADGERSELNLQSFLDAGIDEMAAVAATDASLSIMISLMAGEEEKTAEPTKETVPEQKPVKEIGEMTCTGKLVYTPSEAGYYRVDLDEPLKLNCGHSYDKLWLFDHNDDDLGNVVNRTVQVQGTLYENEGRGIVYMPHSTIELIEEKNGTENVSSEGIKTIRWKSAFERLLQQSMQAYPDHRYKCSYSVYDMDKDGTPELFLKEGTCEADYRYTVYKYNVGNGRTDLIGGFPGSHGSVCGLDEANAIVLHTGQMMVESIRKISGDYLMFETVLFQGEVEEYHDLQSLPSYELDDTRGLEWSEDSVTGNQQIIDALMKENAAPSDAAQPGELEQNPAFVPGEVRGIGAFDVFFAQYGYGSDVTWEGIGTISDIFGMNYNNGEIENFHVYRVDHADGLVEYFLMPYNDFMGEAPVVYRYSGMNSMPQQVFLGYA